MRRWRDGRATPGQLAPRVRWQSSWLKGSRAPAGHSASMSPGELRDLGAVDLAVYSVVADTPTPSLDEPLRQALQRRQ